MRMSPQEFAQRFPDHPESRRLTHVAGTKTKPKNNVPKAPSWLEAKFQMDVKAMKLPAPITEHVFHPDRRWRFDFAWIELKLAVEIEGGVLSRGRHVRPKGFQNDCEKYNAAANLGWTVLRFTGADVKSGLAISTIERTFKAFEQEYRYRNDLPCNTNMALESVQEYRSQTMRA